MIDIPSSCNMAAADARALRRHRSKSSSSSLTFLLQVAEARILNYSLTLIPLDRSSRPALVEALNDPITVSSRSLAST